MFIEYNPNPCGRRVGDCAVRAIAKALDTTWEGAYITLALNGLQMCDANKTLYKEHLFYA